MSSRARGRALCPLTPEIGPWGLAPVSSHAGDRPRGWPLCLPTMDPAGVRCKTHPHLVSSCSVPQPVPGVGVSPSSPFQLGDRLKGLSFPLSVTGDRTWGCLTSSCTLVTGRGVPVCLLGMSWGCSLLPLPPGPTVGCSCMSPWRQQGLVVEGGLGLGFGWLLGVSVIVSFGLHRCAPCGSPRFHYLGASWRGWPGSAPGLGVKACRPELSSSAECWQPRRASPAAGHRPGDSREMGFSCVPLHPAGHRAGRPRRHADRGVRMPTGTATAGRPEACRAGLT